MSCAGDLAATGPPQRQMPQTDSGDAFRQPAPRQGPEGARPAALPGTAGAIAAHAAVPHQAPQSAERASPMQQPPGVIPSPAAAAPLQGAALITGIPLPQLQPPQPQQQPLLPQPHASGEPAPVPAVSSAAPAPAACQLQLPPRSGMPASARDAAAVHEPGERHAGHRGGRPLTASGLLSMAIPGVVIGLDGQVGLKTYSAGAAGISCCCPAI